jgi:hypothetical protein
MNSRDNKCSDKFESSKNIESSKQKTSDKKSTLSKIKEQILANSHSHSSSNSNSKDVASPVLANSATFTKKNRTLSRVDSIKTISGFHSPKESGSGTNSPEILSRRNSTEKSISASNPNSPRKTSSSKLRVSDSDLKCIKTLTTSTDSLHIQLKNRAKEHYFPLENGNEYLYIAESNAKKRVNLATVFSENNSSSENGSSPLSSKYNTDVCKHNSRSRPSVFETLELESAEIESTESTESTESAEIEVKEIETKEIVLAEIESAEIALAEIALAELESAEIENDDEWPDWDGAHSYEDIYENINENINEENAIGLQTEREEQQHKQLEAHKQFQEQCEKFMIFSQHAKRCAEHYSHELNLPLSQVQKTSEGLTQEIMQDFIQLNLK